MPANPILIITLPGGAVGAFPLDTVAEARRLAAKLGFSPSPADKSAPEPAAVAQHQPEQPWVTVERLAAASGLKPAHIRASARAGLLPSRRVGRRLLLRADALSQGAVVKPAAEE